MEASKLKAARLLEQMSAHLATDAGKEIANKVGFVYQLNISPKVCMISSYPSVSPMESA
uniref:Uncharacterized protein n=1 Tax=Triticum urartu TaxID=4572 RepID=A0A8R7UW75_TRIUA